MCKTQTVQKYKFNIIMRRVLKICVVLRRCSFAQMWPCAIERTLTELTISAQKTKTKLFFLSRLDLKTAVTCSFHAALNIFLRNTESLELSAARLVLTARKRHHVSIPPQNFSLAAHPSMYRVQAVNTMSLFFLFICLTFFMCTFHQDSSAPPLSQKLYRFRT